MKKILSILIAAALIAAILPAAVSAEGPAIVLSTQKLRVNGVTVDCERYNIDGANYFKLRDLACALNGTGSQFSVSWDGENKCVSLVSGEAYTPIGGELDPAVADKSASGAPSGDKLLINGEDYSSLSAYKFEGANFYKLKELGDALGFRVDYDSDSRTMIVVTRAYSEPTEWLTVETIYNENGVATSHNVDTYDAEGRLLHTLWEDESSTYESAYVYDELGRQISCKYDCVQSYGDEVWEEHSLTTYEFDVWGQHVRTVYEAAGDVSSETTFAYDDDGRLLMEETLTNAGRSTYYYSYDENGYMSRMIFTEEDQVIYTLEYEYDADGHLLVTRQTDSNGELSFTLVNTYVNGLETESRYISEAYESTASYSYDEEGRQIRSETVSGDYKSTSSCIYDEEGRLVQEEYTSGEYSSVTVYAFNEMGLLTKRECTYSDGSFYEDTYTYDEEGNVLTNVYHTNGSTTTCTYTYDREAHKQTILNVYEYAGAEQPAEATEQLKLSVESLELAVGDTYSIGYTLQRFIPKGEKAGDETIIWSSNNENVVTVDGEGNVTAVGAGEAVVTAAFGNDVTASCTVTVASEKFELTLEPANLKLKVDETGEIRCTVKVVGNWRSFRSLGFGDYDEEVVFAYWDEEWQAPGVISLHVVGLEVGMTSIPVYVRDEHNEKTGKTQIIRVTVTE